MKYEIEYTDTFGGEANYSWVTRRKIEVPEKASNNLIRRRARAAMGMRGVRGKWEDMGEGMAFRPSGSCTVMFVNPVY